MEDEEIMYLIQWTSDWTQALKDKKKLKANRPITPKKTITQEHNIETNTMTPHVSDFRYYSLFLICYWCNRMLLIRE